MTKWLLTPIIGSVTEEYVTRCVIWGWQKKKYIEEYFLHQMCRLSLIEERSLPKNTLPDDRLMEERSSPKNISPDDRLIEDRSLPKNTFPDDRLMEERSSLKNILPGASFEADRRTESVTFVLFAGHIHCIFFRICGLCVCRGRGGCYRFQAMPNTCAWIRTFFFAHVSHFPPKQLLSTLTCVGQEMLCMCCGRKLRQPANELKHHVSVIKPVLSMASRHDNDYCCADAGDNADDDKCDVCWR